MTLRHKPSTRTAGVLLLTGALALTGPGSVLTTQAATKTTQTAQAPALPRGPGLMGTITSAAGNTLKITLLTSHQAATVTLTTKTTYLVNGKTTTKRPTWKKGEQIGVLGTKTKTGAYTAKTIMVGRPGGPGGPGGPPPAGGIAPLNGKIVSAGTSTLVVKTAGGTKTFKLTSSTHYLVNGKAASTRPTLKAGEQVHVMAARSGSTLTARTVFIGSMPAPPSAPPPGQ